MMYVLEKLREQPNGWEKGTLHCEAAEMIVNLMAQNLRQWEQIKALKNELEVVNRLSRQARDSVGQP